MRINKTINDLVQHRNVEDFRDFDNVEWCRCAVFSTNYLQKNKHYKCHRTCTSLNDSPPRPYTDQYLKKSPMTDGIPSFLCTISCDSFSDKKRLIRCFWTAISLSTIPFRSSTSQTCTDTRRPLVSFSTARLVDFSANPWSSLLSGLSHVIADRQ